MQLLHREVQDVHFAFRRLIFCMLLRQVEQHSWGQRFESQFVLHLQYIVFRSLTGAGGKLDLIGTHMLCSIDHPQSFVSIKLRFKTL
jgi:hypothetical protein